MSDFQEVISKILSDEEFRKALLADPEGTLKSAGIEPNDEILEVFKDADEESLKELASNFDEDKAAW